LVGMIRNGWAVWRYDPRSQATKATVLPLLVYMTPPITEALPRFPRLLVRMIRHGWAVASRRLTPGAESNGATVADLYDTADN